MRFTIATSLCLVVMVSASAIPRSEAEFNTSALPVNPLEARDTYDCKGSSMCKTLQVRACDEAVNSNIIRNDDINYGAPG